jgi:hypothetical protein
MVMSHRAADLSYEILSSRHEGGQPRTVARLRCARCPAHVDVTMNGHHNAEGIIKQFRRLGWQADIHTGRLCLCRACQERKDHRAMSPVTTLKPATAAAAVAALPEAKPTLTPEQKACIRQKLDSQFDETLGYYLDDWSDERVASECKVARAQVVQIREIGYGVLKADPGLDQIERDLARARADIDRIASTLIEARKRLGIR